MRFQRKNITLAALAFVLGATSLFAVGPRPGNWKITMKMEAPGMPAMKPFTVEVCLKKEDAGDLEKTLPRASGENCKMVDHKLEGNTITWTVECSGKHPATGKGEVTYDGDSAYKGKMVMSTEGTEMTMHYDAVRSGECAAK